MDTPKKKIVILGGGMGSLSAAYELTDYPGWQDHYSITLYQLGWRLGGKTATGRGPCDRVEEHGIHILQGWYDTTFRLLRDVYAERAQKQLAPGSPLQDLFKDGLVANNTTLLTEFIPETGKWSNWPLIFPETKEQPGAGEPLSMWSLMRKGLALTLEMLFGSPYAKNIGPVGKWILDHFFPDYLHHSDATAARKPGCTAGLLKLLTGFIERRAKKEFGELIDVLAKLDTNDGNAQHVHHARLLEIIEKYIQRIEAGGLPYAEGETPRRHVALGICFAYYNMKGILKDVYDPQTKQFLFDRIDKYDYREWLGMQGAPQWLVDSVIVRFFYTGTFANLVNETGGAVAAGTALQFFAKSVGYKGSFVYQMTYGTGEVMIMPIYEVLKSRGVAFKFFHSIEQVHYAGSGLIEKITYAEQVRLKGSNYDPVKKIMNGSLSAWPAEPLYQQIDPADAERLQAGNINLEDPWANWQNAVPGQMLQRGVDFDEVILGIPLGTLKTICSELIEHNDRWKAMAANVITTPTQSAQLWFLPTLAEMGFDLRSWGLPPQFSAPNVVVYQNPMYSWLDSSLVLPSERWPSSQQPKFLAYFTGPYLLRKPLPPFTDHLFQQGENERLRNAFEQWLFDNAGWFWPKATTYLYPQGLNFQLLADVNNSPEGYARFEQQFFRANVRPTDHYTLSVPNSALYRLKADASGFENLYLCGDWIDFGGNVGYIDGTIQSGQQAAQALRTKLALGGHKAIWSGLTA